MKKNLLKMASMALAVMSLTFVACSSDEDETVYPTLNFANETISIAPAAGTQTIALTSNSAWKVDQINGSFITSVSPMSGTGNATLTITVTENDAALRTGTITLKTTESSPIITSILKVEQQVTAQPATLTLSADTVKTDFAADTLTFNITSSSTWAITVPSGITVNPTSGTGDAVVTVYLADNMSGDVQYYNVVVACDKYPQPSSNIVFAQPKAELVYDGVTYKVAKMDDGHWWMAQNLRYIPAGVTPLSNYATTDNEGMWYPYDLATSAASTDANYIEQKGYLYSFATAVGVSALTATNYNTFEGAQGICPAGWHIPTVDECNGLASASSPYWDAVTQKGAPIADLNADGFNCTLTGMRSKSKDQAAGSFSAANYNGDFSLGYIMSSTAYQYKVNTDGSISCMNKAIMLTNNATYQRATIANAQNFGGIPVRCIKD